MKGEALKKKKKLVGKPPVAQTASGSKNSFLSNYTFATDICNRFLITFFY